MCCNIYNTHVQVSSPLDLMMRAVHGAIDLHICLLMLDDGKYFEGRENMLSHKRFHGLEYVVFSLACSNLKDGVCFVRLACVCGNLNARPKLVMSKIAARHRLDGTIFS